MHLTQLNGPTGALAAVSFTAYPQELSSAGMVAAKPIWARLRRRYGCRHEGFRLSQVHSPFGQFRRERRRYSPFRVEALTHRVPRVALRLAHKTVIAHGSRIF